MPWHPCKKYGCPYQFVRFPYHQLIVANYFLYPSSPYVLLNNGYRHCFPPDDVLDAYSLCDSQHSWLIYPCLPRHRKHVHPNDPLRSWPYFGVMTSEVGKTEVARIRSRLWSLKVSIQCGKQFTSPILLRYFVIAGAGNLHDMSLT